MFLPRWASAAVGTPPLQPERKIDVLVYELYDIQERKIFEAAR